MIGGVLGGLGLLYLGDRYQRSADARKDQQRREEIKRLLGQSPQVSNFEAETFPGEAPIQGLYNVTPGSGYLGGKIPAPDFWGGLLSVPGMESIGGQGLLSYQASALDAASKKGESSYQNVTQDDKGQWWGLNAATGTVEPIPMQGGEFAQYRTVQGTDPNSGMPTIELVSPGTGQRIGVGVKPRTSADAATIANARGALDDLNSVKQTLFSNLGPNGELTDASELNRSSAVAGSIGAAGTRGRDADQALRRAIETILRARTGAAAPASEVNSYMRMYAPSPLDSDAAAREKIRRLEQFFNQSLDLMRAGNASAPQGKPKTDAVKKYNPATGAIE